MVPINRLNRHSLHLKVGCCAFGRNLSGNAVHFMNNTLLSTEAESILLSFSSLFNGYTYAKQQWGLTGQPMHQRFGELLHQASITGRLSPRPADNFAANFYLYRMFRFTSWDGLPPAYTPEWYNMLLYYLHLYRTPVPTGYPTEDEAGFRNWAARPKGAAEATAAELRRLLMRR